MSTQGLLRRVQRLEQSPARTDAVNRCRNMWEVTGVVPHQVGLVREVCRQEAVLAHARGSLPGHDHNRESFTEYAGRLDEIAADPATWVGKEFPLMEPEADYRYL